MIRFLALLIGVLAVLGAIVLVALIHEIGGAALANRRDAIRERRLQRSVPVWLFLKHGEEALSTTRAPSPERCASLRETDWDVVRVDVSLPWWVRDGAKRVVKARAR